MTFYMRAKGKISGPYDLLTLQKLIQRGVLTQLHEVSADQRTWVAAGEYEDLFPGRRGPVRADTQRSRNPPGEINLNAPDVIRILDDPDPPIVLEEIDDSNKGI
jgi:hypothetical protein